MAAIFPDKPLERITASDVLFTHKFGGFELKTVSRRDAPKQPAEGPPKLETHEVEPELEVLTLGDRYAVIFSRYDLSCALERHESMECPGYTRDSAARLGLNVLLYALER